MLDGLLKIVSVGGGLAALVNLAVMLIHPLREKIMGREQSVQGQKCLLRSDMLRVYYKNRDAKKIRQYEYENFLMEYYAYKALGGNSFVNRIYSDVQKWEVVS